MSLPPVMAVPEHQLDRARRLANYCWDLDKTDVWIITITAEEDAAFVPQYPENAFHSRQAFGLHHAAQEVGGRPFIWMEADSIPLKPDWADLLSEAYSRCGSKFLISSDSHPPFDLVGGIGVYCAETEWLVPCHYPRSSWDMWLIEAVPHLVARTGLIQHSYGIYDATGHAVEHRFPRDSGILRPDAVIFHRDPKQDLCGV